MLSTANNVTVDTEAKTFTVDGDPFPWFISEKGPRAIRHRDDLYSVHVTVFAQDSFSCAGVQAQPVINGITFPWYLTTDGFTCTSRNGDIPAVDLAFFTHEYVGPFVDDIRGVYAYNGDKVAV